jgi:hypothetical protein
MMVMEILATEPELVAHDQKLSRDVALKVLPSELARSPERLARFEREAKAIAAQLWRVPILENREATWDDAQQLTFDQSFVQYVTVTRDGKNVVLNSDRSGNLDLWLLLPR